MDPEKIVLDSWSVLAFLGAESKGKEVMDLVTRVIDRRGTLLMSVVNVGEVWYTIARRVSAEAADEDIEGLLKLGTQFIDASWDLTRTAAGFRWRHRMSYANAFAAAVAKTYNATLVTGDPEFKPLVREVRIKFV